MSDWNAAQYMKFHNERTQPSIDLIHRIDTHPTCILDIGCGPGNSTHTLSQYFPQAAILGIDNSENMLQTAAASYPHLKFQKCTIPDDLHQLPCFDLIFSNACLQWVPNHKVVLPKLMQQLNPNGILAVQMPIVQHALFYKALHTLLSDAKWQRLRQIQNFHNGLPEETYDILTQNASHITMWDTTYYHIVPSYNAIIDWYQGSGLRPYLAQLTDAEKPIFLTALIQALKTVFPVQADNTILLKMPRLFFIAQK